MKNLPRSAANTPKTERPRPLALALTAGGARGAYQIGCWKAFHERGVSFEAVSGSSIGALNAAFICQGDVDLALSFWRELSETRLLRPDFARLRVFLLRLSLDAALFLVPVPNLRAVRIIKYASVGLKLFSRHGSLGTLVREGLVRLEDLEPLVGRYLDFREVLRQPTPLFTTATEVPNEGNGRLGSRWFKLQDLDEDGARKILTASVSLPLVSPLIRHNERSYMDGGIGQWAPIAPLYEAGFRHIVLLSTKARIRYNHKRYPGCTVSVIHPERSLGRFPRATFRFSPSAISRWIDQGYKDATLFLDRHRKA